MKRFPSPRKCALSIALFAGLFCLTPRLLAQTNVFYVPHFAVGPAYLNQLLVSNFSATSATLSVVARSSDGTVLGNATREIAANSFETLTLESLLELPADSVGWLQITSTVAEIRIQYGFSDINRTDDRGDLLSEVAFLQTKFNFGFVALAPDVSTGYGLANPNSVPVNVIVDLYDRAGVLRGSVTVTVPAFGHQSQLFHELFSVISDPFFGYATVRAGLPIAAIHFVDYLGNVALVEPQRAGKTLSFASSLSRSDIFAGLSVANIGGSKARLEISAYVTDGTLFSGPGIVNPRTFDLDGGRQLVLLTSEIFGFGTHVAFDGLIVVRATGLGGIFGGNPQITGLMTIGGRDQTRFTALAGQTAGAMNLAAHVSQDSPIGLRNLGTLAANVQILLRGSGGDLDTINETMPANGSLFVTPAEAVPGFTGPGSVQVIGDVPMLGGNIQELPGLFQANLLKGLAPNPFISQIIPSNLAPGFPVQIDGQGFGSDPTAVRVLFTSQTGGFAAAAPSTLVDTRIDVTAPVTATSGFVIVEVGGRQSLAVPFLTPNPVPSLTSLTPDTVTEGHVGFIVELSGTSFVAGSRVLFNGEEVPTTFVSPVLLRARVSSVDLPIGIPATVLVRNPAPGGGDSAASSITITTRTPRQRTVTVGNEPRGVAVAPGAINRAIVTNPSDNTVTIVDLTANIIIATLPVGILPTEVAVNPTTGFAVVTNSLSNSVSIVNVATALVTATLPVGSLPFGVDINAATNVAVVANNGDNSVSIINLAVPAVTATVTGLTINRPTAVAVNTENNTALVVNSGINSVVTINLATATASGGLPIGSGAAGAAFAIVGASRDLVVANTFDNTVSIIDLLAINSATLSVPSPERVAVDPTQGLAFVTSLSESKLTIIDLAKGRIIATFPVGTTQGDVAVNTGTSEVVVSRPGSNDIAIFSFAQATSGVTIPVESRPRGLEIYGEGSRVLVTNEGSDSVSLIDTLSNLVIARQNVGSMPAAVAHDTERNRLYVANLGSDTVTVLDDASLAVITTIPVGVGPLDIAIENDMDVAVVANRQGDSLTFINLFSSSAGGPLEITDPFDIVIDPLRDWALVSSPQAQSVFIVSLQTQSLLATIPVPGVPGGIAIIPELDRLYVADASAPRIIHFDYVNLTQLGVIDLLTAPRRIGINPRSRAGLITVDIGLPNIVLPFDADFNQVFQSLTLGTQPARLGFDVETDRAWVSNLESNSITVVQLP